ncbi:MAG TPA: insulinase family protein [Candidatus Eremiobacteraceae bacterium]|nr:insulinase family protein [Candidatus Eremiobacteraceae bacterium]
MSATAANAASLNQTGAIPSTLSNGLRIIVVPMKHTPLASVGVYYDVGSADAPASDPGLATAVAAMLTTHVAGLSGTQVTELTSALGGASGEVWGTRTTLYYNEVALSDLSAALRIEADRMLGFGASNDDWSVERSVYAQAASMNEGNFNVLWHSGMLHALQPRSPIARDKWTSESLLNRDSLSVLDRFRATWFTPSNAVIIVAGGVDPQAILADIRSDFGSLPGGAAPKHAGDDLTPPHAANILFKRNLVTRPAYACVDEPGSSSRDFAAAQILNDVVQSTDSALSEMQESRKALTTSFTQIFGDRELTIMCAQAAVGFVENNNSLADALRAVLASYAEHGVSAADVAAAVKYEHVQRVIQDADPYATMDEWGTYVAALGYSTPDVYFAAIDRVTPADVDRLAREVFSPRTIAVGRVVPAPSAAPTTAIAPPSATAAPGTATLPQWASAVVRDVDGSLANAPTPSETTLANGIRVITVNRPGSGIVQVFGRVKVSPQVEAPPGDDGVDLVLTHLFAAGPADMSHEDFARRIGALGGQESAGADFNLSILPADFGRGLALLADAELHPSFAGQEFGRAKLDAVDDAADQTMSLGRSVQQSLYANLLPPGDPAARVASPVSVFVLTAPEVRSYYEAAFRPERTTIVVVGDIAPAAAVSGIERAFGMWSDASTPAPPDDLPTLPENTAARVVMPAHVVGIRIVELGETVEMRPSSDDYEAFSAGMEVLGGDLWSSRLRRDIVDNRGLAVSVKQQVDIETNRATLTITYVCAPVNSVKVRNLITSDIREIQTTPLTADELGRAKALLVRQELLQMGSPKELAQQYLGFAGLGLPLDEPALRAARYLGLTPREVMLSLAARLRADGFVDVEFGTQ